ESATPATTAAATTPRTSTRKRRSAPEHDGRGGGRRHRRGASPPCERETRGSATFSSGQPVVAHAIICYSCACNHSLELEDRMTTLATTVIPTGTWVVDPAHSKVGFAVKHMGIATVRGEFTDCEGTLEIGDDLASAKAYGT